MNMARVFLFAVALIAPVVFCVSQAAAESDKEAVSDAVAADGRFAVDLYKQLSKEKPADNLFFSPYSIFSALTMTAEGARGETAEQMYKTLCFPKQAKPLASIHAGLGELNRKFNAPKAPFKLVVANALWGEKTYPFLPAYVAAINKYYKTDGVFEVDFVHNPEAARRRINEWVEKQTKEKIKNLIAEGQITPLTRLVLTNAIYFKGSWQDEFEEGMTRSEDFHLSAEKKIEVRMMNQTERHPYAEDDSLQALELRYKGGALSMVILLPKTKDGLAALEKSLSADRVSELIAKLRPRRTEVYLPKFKLETSYDLKAPLRSLGMKTAFTDAADFSGMDGSHDLYIDFVVHKAYVDVNEQGTEAAAATGVGMTLRAAPLREPPTVFRADHPFLFLIRDRQSDAVIFMGRVVDPGK